MSTENTTLQEFISSDNAEVPNEEREDNTDSATDDGQSDGTPSGESLCPCYTEGIGKCRSRLDESLIQNLNVEKIGCGHGVDYISNEVGVTLSEGTAEGYTYILRRYVEFLHENQFTVVGADFKQVMEYFNRLVKRNRAESTIACHRSAIMNLYKYISFHKDAEVNFHWTLIREEIDPSSYKTPEPREREPLEKSEVTKLYDAIGSFRNRLMIQVAVELGPRNTDVRSIKVDDVNFEDQNIKLANTKAGGTYSGILSDQLLLLLRRWIDEERAAHPKAETNDYLFPSRESGMIGDGRFRNIVKEAAERAGIQETTESEAPLTEREKEVLGTDKDYKEYHKVTPHALRHTFNYLLQEAGIPREARSKALDHDSEEVTKEFYDHEESNYEELMRELFSTQSSLI